MFNCAFNSFNPNSFNESLQKGRPSYFRDHKANYFVTFGDKINDIPLQLKEQNDLERENSKKTTEAIIKSDQAFFKMSFIASTAITLIGSFSLYYTMF